MGDCIGRFHRRQSMIWGGQLFVILDARRTFPSRTFPGRLMFRVHGARVKRQAGPSGDAHRPLCIVPCKRKQAQLSAVGSAAAGGRAGGRAHVSHQRPRPPPEPHAVVCAAGGQHTRAALRRGKLHRRPLEARHLQGRQVRRLSRAARSPSARRALHLRARQAAWRHSQSQLQRSPPPTGRPSAAVVVGLLCLLILLRRQLHPLPLYLPAWCVRRRCVPRPRRCARR